jgi:outer membrane receptor protein involved in Fe transport
VENRLELGNRFFVNAGLRLEAIATARVPGNAASDRPDFPSNTIAQVNPRISAAYRVRPTTTVRSSFGTGIRPAGGFEIAFTKNPKLKPERTVGVDAIVEQRLFGNRLSLEGGYFYNRYYDLIVSLGGSLARLSSFRSDNLANSRAQGGEFVARARPHSALSFGATYTYLDSEILSLSGASNVAPAYFEVGQPLLRRPRHLGAVDSTFVWGRVSANAVAHFRGETLETEPNFGASAGLFPGPGYTWLGINLNVRVARGLTVYGNLRNALNERHEEVLGYPSPRLNFVSGIKWAFRRE